jgi:hypothetical protein
MSRLRQVFGVNHSVVAVGANSISFVMSAAALDEDHGHIFDTIV